jgi:hypothetical protein
MLEDITSSNTRRGGGEDQLACLSHDRGPVHFGSEKQSPHKNDNWDAYRHRLFLPYTYAWKNNFISFLMALVPPYTFIGISGNRGNKSTFRICHVPQHHLFISWAVYIVLEPIRGCVQGGYIYVCQDFIISSPCTR